MKRVLGYFAQGLVLLTPLAVTVWVCWVVFTRVDGWLGLPVPGAGFVATLAIITVVGFLGSSILTRSAVGVMEGVMNRLPLVRLLYGSTKDLLNAFVGEKRRFDRPVLVTLTPDGKVRAIGFVTQESLAHVGLPGQVAVYCPFSYSVAGQVYVVDTAQIEPLDVASSDAMAFVVSGGVAGIVPTSESTGEFPTNRH
ncbi:MAG: hypothetical protein RLZZ621_162 [Gemmatimonadota bacterium]|jgi:uncharacterized membrane protein